MQDGYGLHYYFLFSINLNKNSNKNLICICYNSFNNLLMNILDFTFPSCPVQSRHYNYN